MEIRITNVEGIRYTTIALLLAALEQEVEHMRGEFRESKAVALEAEIATIRDEVIAGYGGKRKAAWFIALEKNVGQIVTHWLRQYHG